MKTTVALYESNDHPDGHTLVWTGPLADFVRDNELEDDERETIIAALAISGEYLGGGGASPEYKLVEVAS
jgi:hypothetical protein